MKSSWKNKIPAHFGLLFFPYSFTRTVFQGTYIFKKTNKKNYGSATPSEVGYLRVHEKVRQIQGNRNFLKHRFSRFRFWSRKCRASVRRPPIISDIARSPALAVELLFSAACPYRVHTVHLRQRLHHGGHFDVDVFRHRRPRVPFLHHIPAVMIPFNRTGGWCAGQRRMRGFPPLHPSFPSWTMVWQRYFAWPIINVIFCMYY